MDDLISRQAAIEEIESHIRTAEEPYYLHDTEKVMNHAFEVAASCVYNLPSAEPERKKPDHGYMWICPVCGLEVHSDFRRCVRCGWDRPSAEPERKKGRWILYESQRKEDVACGNYLYICSKCGKSDIHAKTQEVPFCWWCGADMRGGEDATAI